LEVGRGFRLRIALLGAAVLLVLLPFLDWLHEGDHGCADPAVACVPTTSSPAFDPPVAASAVSGWQLAPLTSAVLLATAIATVAFARSRDRRAAGLAGLATLAGATTSLVVGVGALDRIAHHQLVTTPVTQGGLETTGTWLWDLSLPAVLSLAVVAAAAAGVVLLFHADRPRGRPAAASTANATGGRFRRAGPIGPATRRPRRAPDERRSTP
jgi:hypothetical protein